MRLPRKIARALELLGRDGKVRHCLLVTVRPGQRHADRHLTTRSDLRQPDGLRGSNRTLGDGDRTLELSIEPQDAGLLGEDGGPFLGIRRQAQCRGESPQRGTVVTRGDQQLRVFQTQGTSTCIAPARLLQRVADPARRLLRMSVPLLRFRGADGERDAGSCFPRLTPQPCETPGVGWLVASDELGRPVVQLLPSFGIRIGTNHVVDDSRCR